MRACHQPQSGPPVPPACQIAASLSRPARRAKARLYVSLSRVPAILAAKCAACFSGSSAISTASTLSSAPPWPSASALRRFGHGRPAHDQHDFAARKIRIARGPRRQFPQRTAIRRLMQLGNFPRHVAVSRRQTRPRNPPTSRHPVRRFIEHQRPRLILQRIQSRPARTPPAPAEIPRSKIGPSATRNRERRDRGTGSRNSHDLDARPRPPSAPGRIPDR
jgi:hypothetical protein